LISDPEVEVSSPCPQHMWGNYYYNGGNFGKDYD
jgi:hypothetical protein